MEPLQTGLAIVEPVLPAHQKVHVHGGGPHTRRALRMGPEGHGIAGFRGTQCKLQRQLEPVFLVADGEGDTAQTLQGRDPPVHEHRAQLTHPGAADQQIVVAAVVADAIAAVLAGVQAGAGRQQHLLHPSGQAEQHGHPVRAGRQRRHPQLIPIEVIEMATHDAVLLIPQMAQQRDAGEQQGEMGTRQPTGRLPGEALGMVDVGRHVGRRQGEPAGGRWCGQGIPVRQPGGRGPVPRRRVRLGEDQMPGELLHEGDQVGIAAPVDGNGLRIEGRQGAGLLAGAIRKGAQVCGFPACHVSVPSGSGWW